MQILLTAHITGAILTAAVIAICFLIKPLTKILVFCGVFQILSGVWLFVLHPTSFASFCARVGLYLFFVSATLVYCYFKDRQKQKAFLS